MAGVWVMRLRDPLSAAGLLVLAALVAFSLLFDLRRSVDYVPEPVVTLPWGAGEAGVGRATGPDGRHYGPQSFAVGADGRVWVLDSARRRVLVLAPDGRPQGAVAVRVAAAGTLAAGPGGGTWLTDLALLPDGALLVVDARAARLLRVDASGAVRQAWALPDHLLPPGRDRVVVPERVAVDRDGTVYLTHSALSDDRYSRGLLRLGPRLEGPTRLAELALQEGGAAGPAPGSLLPVAVESFAVVPGGLLVEVRQGVDPFRRRIQLYDPSGRPVREWPLASDVAIREAAVLGRDRLGGIAALLDPGRPSGRVVRLGADGSRLERPVGWSPAFPLTVYGRMDRRGHLLLAAADEQGWRLTRYRLVTRTSVVPAGTP